MKTICIMTLVMVASACSSFKAERLDEAKADEKAMLITDKWVDGDTVRVMQGAMNQIRVHKRFAEYKAKIGGKRARVFVGEIRNMTAEPYFPSKDLEDALLNELSQGDDFTLLDATRREDLLKEITYQNNGMVNPDQAKRIGLQSGADLMIFGDIYMKPETRSGKTIKTYSVNLRMTEIETSEEVCRVREKINKYSEQ